jgi:cytochrome P450
VFREHRKSKRPDGRPKVPPPGPRGRLLTGNLLDYTRDHLGFLTRCAREHGDVVRLRFVNVRTYLLNHPDHIEYVLVGNNRNFIKSKGVRHSLGFLGDGLLTSEGSFWRRQRRLAQPAFHRERISVYGEVMVECAGQMISTWKGGETRRVHEDMARLALDVVAKTLFGTLLTTEFEEVSAALTTITQRFTGRGGYYSTFPREFLHPPTYAFDERYGSSKGISTRLSKSAAQRAKLASIRVTCFRCSSRSATRKRARA